MIWSQNYIAIFRGIETIFIKYFNKRDIFQILRELKGRLSYIDYQIILLLIGRKYYNVINLILEKKSYSTNLSTNYDYIPKEEKTSSTDNDSDYISI